MEFKYPVNVEDSKRSREGAVEDDGPHPFLELEKTNNRATGMQQVGLQRQCDGPSSNISVSNQRDFEGDVFDKYSNKDLVLGAVVARNTRCQQVLSDGITEIKESFQPPMENSQDVAACTSQVDQWEECSPDAEALTAAYFEYLTPTWHTELTPKQNNELPVPSMDPMSHESATNRLQRSCSRDSDHSVSSTGGTTSGSLQDKPIARVQRYRGVRYWDRRRYEKNRRRRRISRSYFRAGVTGVTKGSRCRHSEPASSAAEINRDDATTAVSVEAHLDCKAADMSHLTGGFGRMQWQFAFRIMCIIWYYCGSQTIVMTFLTQAPPRFPVCPSVDRLPQFEDGNSPWLMQDCDPMRPLSYYECDSNYLYLHPGATIVSEFRAALPQCHEEMNKGFFSGVAWTNSAFFVGFLLGVVSLSQMGDRFGRRKSYILSILLLNLGAVATVLTGSLIQFGLARLLVGVGVGGAGLLTFVTLTEISPDKGRHIIAILHATAFALGGCTVCVIAMVVSGWRVLLSCITVPGLFASVFVCCNRYAIESPRWLAVKNRRAEALATWQFIGHINGANFSLPTSSEGVVHQAQHGMETIEDVRFSGDQKQDSDRRCEIAGLSSFVLLPDVTRDRTLVDPPGKDRGSGDPGLWNTSPSVPQCSQGPFNYSLLHGHGTQLTSSTTASTDTILDAVRSAPLNSWVFSLVLLWFSAAFTYYGVYFHESAMTRASEMQLDSHRIETHSTHHGTQELLRVSPRERENKLSDPQLVEATMPSFAVRSQSVSSRSPEHVLSLNPATSNAANGASGESSDRPIRRNAQSAGESFIPEKGNTSSIPSDREPLKAEADSSGGVPADNAPDSASSQEWIEALSRIRTAQFNQRNQSAAAASTVPHIPNDAELRQEPWKPLGRSTSFGSNGVDPLMDFRGAMRALGLTTAVAFLVEIPIAWMSIWAASLRCCGRKGIIMTQLFCGGVLCLIAARQTAKLADSGENLSIVVLANVGRLCVSGGFVLLYLYSSELFPTSIRSSVVGTFSMSARLGGIATPIAVQALAAMSPIAPLAVFGCLCMASSVIGMCVLPETLQRPMFDTIAGLRAHLLTGGVSVPLGKLQRAAASCVGRLWERLRTFFNRFVASPGGPLYPCDAGSGNIPGAYGIEQIARSDSDRMVLEAPSRSAAESASFTPVRSEWAEVLCCSAYEESSAYASDKIQPR